VQRRKTTSAEGLETFLGQFKITQVPRDDCLVLDTDTTSPQTAARTIVQNFSLA